MTDLAFYPTSSEEFSAIVARLKGSLDVEARLPDWPFRAQRSHVDICQYGNVLEGQFEGVLARLVEKYGDSRIYVAAFNPPPERHRNSYGSYMAFVLPASKIIESYWDSVMFEPDGEITGAMGNVANVVGISGDSGRWAVWAERRWDLVMISTPDEHGPWISEEPEFVSYQDALANFTEPDFKIPLPQKVRDAFVANFQKRGM